MGKKKSVSNRNNLSRNQVGIGRKYLGLQIKYTAGIRTNICCKVG